MEGAVGVALSHPLTGLDYINTTPSSVNPLVEVPDQSVQSRREDPGHGIRRHSAVRHVTPKPKRETD